MVENSGLDPEQCQFESDQSHMKTIRKLTNGVIETTKVTKSGSVERTFSAPVKKKKK